ncbi:hypothetical protein B1T43_27030, partial [Mycobacterium kansasii]
PHERLIACRNPALAAERARKRNELLAATETALARIAERVERGSLAGAGKIGEAVGQIVNKYKVSLARIAERVERGSLAGAGKIGEAVGQIVNKYKVSKHFHRTITDTSFAYERDHAAITAEAALDGIYVLRTSVPATDLDAPAVVTGYKNLAYVERDFRSIKTDDLDLRPIHHRLSERVKAHVLICLLACYVTWHLRKAWAP